MDDIVELPDGSAFFTAELPLPRDHWLYAPGHSEPPMPLRTGEDDPFRRHLEQAITEATQWAYRGCTMNGTSESIDPDALVQNMIVGLIGYHTPDGRG